MVNMNHAKPGMKRIDRIRIIWRSRGEKILSLGRGDVRWLHEGHGILSELEGHLEF